MNAAISAFEHVAAIAESKQLGLHQCHVHNNIASAYLALAERATDPDRVALEKKAKSTVLRALELSAQEYQIDVWAAAQHNLAGILFSESQRADAAEGAFLRIQAIAAVSSSIEAYPQTGFSLQMAGAQVLLARILFEHARLASARLKEIYLFRCIQANEVASNIYDQDVHPREWSTTQFLIGSAFLLHADDADRPQALADLEQAVTYFELAAPGLQSAGADRQTATLAAYMEAATSKLRALREQPLPD